MSLPPAAAMRRPSFPRRAFTLVEALVSTAITAVASAAVLLGIANSIDATDSNLQQTLAIGMAQQLMDEIGARRYIEPGGDPYATSLGPDAGETIGPGRSQFDDIDDYNGYRCQPPTDRFGISLGQDDGQGGTRHVNFQARSGYLGRWHQQVDVYYVDNADPSKALPANSTSNYRAVRVTILVDDAVRGPLQRAQLTRVFAYVPGS